MASAETKPTDLAVGDVLNNNYRLEEKIGEGGMGRVFRATDLKLARRVAVKGLLVSNLDTETLRRFDRETQVMGQLDHPGIVTLYSFGRTRNVPWLAMQLLEGHDLWGELAKHGGRMTPAQMLPLSRQILTALSYLHARNVLHRDLKPSNIHLSPKGKVTLCDFGLARGHRSNLTKTGVVWGTPEYMAPEQILAERELDGRADLYALAVVLFRMIAGASVFAETSDHDLLRAHLGSPRPDISRAVPGLSPLLGAALQKGLAIHPEDRFQNAEEMLASLEVVLALPVGSPSPRAVPVAPPKRVAGTAPLKTPEGKKITRDGPDEEEGDSAGMKTSPVGFKALSSTLVDDDEDEVAPPAPGPTKMLAPSEREELATVVHRLPSADSGATPTPSDAALEEGDSMRPLEPVSTGTVIRPIPVPTAPITAPNPPPDAPMSQGTMLALIIGGALALFMLGLAVAKLLL